MLISKHKLLRTFEMRMKKILLFSFLLSVIICLGQNKNSSTEPETIKVKKYNTENEIKNGSLSFLKGCFFTETVHVNGKIISKTWANPNILVGRRGIVYIENIKKKNADGSFQTLHPKKIIFE